MRPSMGSVGDAHDDAMRESLFATLERGPPAQRRFTSQAEAKIPVFSFVKGWCNPLRPHSALGYPSPIAYEQHMQKAAIIPRALKPRNRPRQQGNSKRLVV